MTYKTVQVSLVGASNPNRTKAISSERTLNMYPEAVPSGAYPEVLLPWPGSKVFSDGLGLGIPRALHTDVATGNLYKVVDTTLYEISSLGVETSRGTVTGTGRVSFSSITDSLGTPGNKLLIATSDNGYVYNITTNSLTRVSDTSYAPGGTVASINSFAIWQRFDNEYAVGDVGTPESIQGENISTAISDADDIVAIYRFREIIYMLGTRTTESYYIGSVGTNPLVPIQSGLIPVGLISKSAITNSNTHLYWIGNDKNLYRTTAYDNQALMPASIARQFEAYNLSDAQLRHIHRDGQDFILIITGTKTWVFSETTGAWFELAYTPDEETYLGFDYAFAYNKHYILSKIDGRVLELDEDLFTDNLQTTIRERVIAPINGSALGKNGGRMMMSRAELIMESGIGSLPSPDPLIMFSASVDGGQTFSNEDWVRAGREGENRLRVEWYNVNSFRQIQIKIRTSDPNFFTFHSLAVDLKMAGRF